MWESYVASVDEALQNGDVRSALEDLGSFTNVPRQFQAVCLEALELAATGTPSVLVPLPTAIDNHQLRNAEALRDAGGAVIIEQANLNSGALAAFLHETLSQSHRLAGMSSAAKVWSKPDATEQVVAVIEELVCG